MGLFQRLFAKKKVTPNNVNQSEEILRLRELDGFLRALLKGDHYVAKSEYKGTLSKYADLSGWFQVLRTSGTLEDYCNKYGISPSDVTAILTRYNNFENLINSQNEQFIKAKMVEQKGYLDTILKACDPKILLDDDQRRVVLTDEDYTLVVAGAGAGKTTTVAAKVKYLVDKQGVDPKKILVISFTNKAVNELKQRIIGELKIECPIATFHSTGNAVIHKQNPDKLNIVDANKLYYVVQDYLRGSVLRNESAVNNLILFFASYFDAPYEGNDLNAFFNHIAKSNFTTMRSELDDFKQQVIDTRTKKAVTIQSEMMRSNQEVEIANFL
ncbi:MAG: UvrD-helicase domain-containing protein [Oscillospiraceae bacterium]|nr:UvrD-helicase domain-containing protein [Oscillospiraceae bacterium]